MQQSGKYLRLCTYYIKLYAQLYILINTYLYSIVVLVISQRYSKDDQISLCMHDTYNNGKIGKLSLSLLEYLMKESLTDN